jgi:tetratricopeptide (TPR) repeat protein
VTSSDPIATANQLKAAGRVADAVACLRAVLAAQPQMFEARFNLAILLHQIGDLDGAEQGYRAVLTRHPEFAPALQGLCGILLAMDRAEEAATYLRQLLPLAKNPADTAMVESALGNALRLQGQLDEALIHSQRAATLAPGIAGHHAGQGDILEQLGRTEDAIALYRDRLKHDPADVPVHARLNTLLFRLGREEEFLGSFDDAIRHLPRAIALLTAKADFLLLAGRLLDAEDCFARALAMEPRNAAAALGHATTLSRRRQFGAAIAAFETARASAPHDHEILTRFAATLLQAREPARAKALAAQILSLRPYDQQALSLMSLALRAQGDGREEALSGYDNFVRVFDLEPPDGFSSMASFNAELENYLGRFQGDRREHLNQTLRGGTRAALRPFGAGHELAERLKLRIDEAIARYIGNMRNAGDHPFTGRRRGKFVFAGSWSSRITDCGYHLNHIHSGGWISSAYYVAVPDVSRNDPQGGHLKFGEPPWDIGLKDPVRRTVQPVPGRLVLFPSYMWHGTIPFQGPQSRTTIAFDVLPV